MQLAQPHKRPDSTPERMFAAKYAWLLRWALHFSHNDRPAAEDLVQDTFVRVLVSWDKLYNLHDLEPLLYSHLRYAYLTERRKVKSYAFQSLSILDSDTLSIELSQSSFDQIEVQNELRSVLQFLLWRRNTAKFASVFLLRFFHGYYPQEIAAISISTRHSVDLSLRQARAELKDYLLQPRQSVVNAKQAIPEQPSPRPAIPVLEFLDELKSRLFEDSRGACPSSEELSRRYRIKPSRAIDCALLAHVSTCRQCLRVITGLTGAPPPSERSIEDSYGPSCRTKSSGTKHSVHTEDASSFSDRLNTADDGCLSCDDAGFLQSQRLAERHPASNTFAPFLTFLRSLLQPGQLPASLAAASACILIIASSWIHFQGARERSRFHTDAEQAVKAEQDLKTSLGPGVLHQRLEIRSKGKVVLRDEYRDLDGHRQPKKQHFTKDAEGLQQQLRSAGIDETDLLSSAGFQKWHDHLSHAEEHVGRSGAQLLELTTETSDGTVRRESLTLRTDTFQPVARTVVFRNQDTIEIAELTRDFIPWAAANREWFEPASPDFAVFIEHKPASAAHPVPLALSESQIDIALLNAELALQSLDAETERITLSRSHVGIRVEGIVESVSRKHEISTRLAMIPNLTVQIFSYSELASRSAASSTTVSVKAESVFSGESTLDRYCVRWHVEPRVCEDLSRRLLNSSSTLVHESRQIDDLLRQHSAGHYEDDISRDLFATLVSQHLQHAKAALSVQDEALGRLGTPLNIEHPSNTVSALSLSAHAEHDLILARELVYQATDQARQASTIAQELASSIAQTRAVLARVSTSPPDPPAVSSRTPTSP